PAVMELATIRSAPRVPAVIFPPCKMLVAIWSAFNVPAVIVAAFKFVISESVIVRACHEVVNSHMAIVCVPLRWNHTSPAVYPVVPEAAEVEKMTLFLPLAASIAKLAAVKEADLDTS